MKLSDIKKMLWVMVVCSLVFLAACGSPAGPAAGQQQNPGSSSQTPANEPIAIEFWYGLGGNLGENMERLIAAFNESQDEIVVTGVVQADYSETATKLQAAIATGNVPAAVLSANAEWARRGYFEELDSYMDNAPAFDKEDVIETFLKQGQVDGKQYFLPMYGTTQVMYYRKDAMEEHSIDPATLTTWEALAAAAAVMTKKEGDTTTFYGWEPMWGRENMMDAVFGKGGSVLSEDGKTVTITTDEWVETWDLFRKWIHEDQIMRIHFGGTGWEYWYKTIDDVMQGHAAGYTGSSGDQGDLDFSIIAAMEQPGWEGYGEGKPVAEAIMAGIPAAASPEQKAAAFEWFSFFMQTENTASWSMNTGYIAVRESAQNDPAFAEFAKENPQITVPLSQATHASSPFVDPTGGKILDALSIAADKVQISNVSAAEALAEAQAEAQAALDEYYSKQ